MNDLDTIVKELGFRHIGTWRAQGESLNHTITDFLNENGVLYAFLINNEVCYIGKTSNLLGIRMAGYINASTSQTTNSRVRGAILEAIKQNRIVEIYVLLDKEEIRYKRFRLRLADGLEDTLIEYFQPKWNYRGTQRIKELVCDYPSDIIYETSGPVKQHNNALASAHITVAKEFLKGKINFPKKKIDYNKFIPELPKKVKLILGESDKVNNVNIIDAGNGQARINSVELLTWYRTNNLRPGDMIYVDFIDEVTIRLRV